VAITYGINTFTWTSPFTTEDLPLIAKAKDMGFDLVEIPIEGMDDLDYGKAAEAFRQADIACGVCAVMGPSRDPTHEDEEKQQGGIEYLKHCVDAAATMGAKLVGGPIYAAVGRTWQATAEQRQRELERCAKNLREVAAYAGDRGVALAVEPLNRFETSFINLAAQAVELVEMVDSPAIKIMLDTFHMNIEEKDLGKAIETAAPYLVHVHANENDRGTPGTGNVTWDKIAAALKKIDYSGALVIESFTTTVVEIARAAAIWRPPAPSQDILASQGKAFLQQLMA
jgi:D-psicose/D-tagatose/L-ribulose 3-epimerase